MESIQETLSGLKRKVDMQYVALKNLELDLGSMHEKIWWLDQVDDAAWASLTQKVTHL